MDKNERGIFFDIPVVTRDGMFHSAILTTFSMDVTNHATVLIYSAYAINYSPNINSLK